MQVKSALFVEVLSTLIKSACLFSLDPDPAYQVYIYEMHHSTMGAFARREVDPVLATQLNETLASGVLNNTLVLLMSDHGLHFGQHLGRSHLPGSIRFGSSPVEILIFC